MTSRLGDPFWADDLSVIYNSDRWIDFFPTSSMTINEKMNALVRLALYMSVILIVYHGKFNYINVFILALMLTYLVIKNQSPESQQEQDILVEKLTNGIDTNDFRSYREAKLRHDNKEEVSPSKGNPFGNVTFADYLDNPDRGPAMDITDPLVKKKIDVLFNENLYTNVSDVFGKVNSQRQFYTMPSTEIPNDRESFQNWLYGEGDVTTNSKTCKENQNACYRYNDPRQQQYMLQNKYIDPI
jgi:hypothetical protein